MSEDTEVHSFSDGEVMFWLVNGTVHIKAGTAFGDPVELTEVEVKELAAALLASVKDQ
jgi:hypothetical protein